MLVQNLPTGTQLGNCRGQANDSHNLQTIQSGPAGSKCFIIWWQETIFVLFFSDDSLWGSTCGQNISTKSPTPAPGIIELASFSSAALLSLIPPPLCATPFNKNPANAPGYNNERENERQGSGSGMMWDWTEIQEGFMLNLCSRGCVSLWRDFPLESLQRDGEGFWTTANVLPCSPPKSQLHVAWHEWQCASIKRWLADSGQNRERSLSGDHQEWEKYETTKKRKNITVFNISHHLFACDMSVLLWHWLMDQQQRKHNWPTDRLCNIFFIQPASDSRCSLQSEAAYVLPTDSTHYCRWTIHFQSPHVT